MGTSAINGQGAYRGLPADFDQWADQGCEGWAWSDVLPSFVRLEDDVDFGDRPHHGQSGPVPIGRTPREAWGAVSAGLEEAATELGHPAHEDLNAPDSTGVSPATWNRRGDARVSTNDAYLEAARGRPNLRVRGHVLVDRVEFDGTRVRGVHVRTRDRTELVEGGEVVLCAGSVQSPAILMRSGIGPADELRGVGVDVLADRPAVGQNLHEHPLAAITLRLRPRARSGSVRVLPGDCCLRFSSEHSDAGSDDLWLLPMNRGADSVDKGRLQVVLTQPFSRGSVRLPSCEPTVEPELDFRALSDPRDLLRLRLGLRHADELVGHSAFDDIGEATAVGNTGQPLSDLSDDELDRWLCTSCEEFRHAAGTCRMGDAGDERSVVDPQCRVIGVEALRVVDASIMPTLVRTGPFLTVVMLAEHLAAMIDTPAG